MWISTPPSTTSNGDPITDPVTGEVAVETDANGPIKLAETYTSEKWDQPTGCTARMWDGTG